MIKKPDGMGPLYVFAAVMWLVVFALVIGILLSGCSSKPDYSADEVPGDVPTVILNYFDMKEDSYGEGTLTVNFFYYEDHDPASYLGSINFKKTPIGLWRVDTYSGYFVYRDPNTDEILIRQDEVRNGMEYFARNVLYMLNAGEADGYMPWAEAIPVDFEQHTDYWELLNNID